MSMSIEVNIIFQYLVLKKGGHYNGLLKVIEINPINTIALTNINQ